MRAAALILAVSFASLGAAEVGHAATRRHHHAAAPAQKAAAKAAAQPEGEPLPAGAPTEPYPMAAWCYGALSEYLTIYDEVTPDLRDIDKMFGTSQPNESKPYESDMAAMHGELDKIAHAVRAAEAMSVTPIAPEGAAAVQQGRGIWKDAEAKTHRELARAWLTWGLPDRCASNATHINALWGDKELKAGAPSALDAAALGAAPAQAAPIANMSTYGAAPAPASGAGQPPADDSAKPNP